MVSSRLPLLAAVWGPGWCAEKVTDQGKAQFSLQSCHVGAGRANTGCFGQRQVVPFGVFVVNTRLVTIKTRDKEELSAVEACLHDSHD